MPSQPVTEPTEPPSSRPSLPELPARLVDPTLVVLVGMAAWMVVSVVLLGAWVFGSGPLSEWFWTSIAGSALGLFGYGVFRWQRAAARRGSRSAQTGLRG
jgi:Protein of unknown function (DUF2530)